MIRPATAPGDTRLQQEEQTRNFIKSAHLRARELVLDDMRRISDRIESVKHRVDLAIQGNLEAVEFLKRTCPCCVHFVPVYPQPSHSELVIFQPTHPQQMHPQQIHPQQIHPQPLYSQPIHPQAIHPQAIHPQAIPPHSYPLEIASGSNANTAPNTDLQIPLKEKLRMMVDRRNKLIKKQQAVTIKRNRTPKKTGQVEMKSPTKQLPEVPNVPSSSKSDVDGTPEDHPPGYPPRHPLRPATPIRRCDLADILNSEDVQTIN